MSFQDHLTLQLHRLSPSQSWGEGGCQLYFIFPKGGVGRSVCASFHQVVVPGDVMVFNPENGTRLMAINGEDLVFWSFSVCMEHLYPLFAIQELALVQRVMDSYKSARLYSASRATSSQWHRWIDEVPPQFNMDHRRQLLNIVAAILTEELKKARKHESGYFRADDVMTQKLEKLTVDEIRTLSVTELASRFNCSARNLNRYFQQYFGLSVRALRMEMRLLKALSLLRNPDLKIISVAEQCDFNHLGLFNSCFKHRFGVSPGQWRKNPVEIKTPAPGPTQSDNNCQLRNNGLCPWCVSMEKNRPEVNASAPGALSQVIRSAKVV